MKITQTSNNVIKINFKYDSKFNKKILQLSDIHLDNPHCKQKLLIEDLEYIKREDGLIMITGDLFDAMGGKRDPRGSKSKIIPELNVDNYFDALVEYHYQFFKPYAKHITIIGDGNHETAVMKNNEINLNKRLVEKLKRHNPNIFYMPYKWWCLYCFERKSGGRMSYRELHHHGSGGSSPVTRGAIGTNRRAVNYPNADIVISGHSHQQLLIPMATEVLTQMGKVKTSLKYEMILGTYKEELEDGKGWAVEKGLNKKTIGCGITEFYYKGGEIKYKCNLITHF